MSSIRELSYDFPVASTSASTSSSQRQTKRATSPRRTTKPRLPPVPRWELATLDDDELDLDREEERDYAALGYPTRRAPSPHIYPYTSATSAYSAYPYTTGYTYGYSTPSPYIPTYDYGVPMQLARSCDSASSALSSCSFSSSHSESRQGRCGKKIRKPRSVSPPACESYPSYPYSSPASSPASSPYFVDDLEIEDEQLEASSPSSAQEEDAKREPAAMALKKQWAALSLRVQFGVFRAKRRMRNRIMSL